MLVSHLNRGNVHSMQYISSNNTTLHIYYNKIDIATTLSARNVPVTFTLPKLGVVGCVSPPDISPRFLFIWYIFMSVY